MFRNYRTFCAVILDFGRIFTNTPCTSHIEAQLIGCIPRLAVRVEEKIKGRCEYGTQVYISFGVFNCGT